MDIMKVLKDMSPEIDRAIEKYIPRKYDKKRLEFALGKPSYKYNMDAPNKAVAKPIWNLLDRGGKRWRPCLMMFVCEAFSGEWKRFVDFAVIPEVIHNGTLLVDDIEDGSELRRGKPCVHKIFGEDVAINAGNAMYFLPLLVLMKNRSRLDKDRIIRAYEIYTQEMINISFGQAMDIAWHKGIANADSITEEEYLQMCAYKTGTLARMAAKLGALISGADEDAMEKIGRLAESIGVAFQIQDDILNIAPSEGWGKETGEDITEGKRTLLVIHTLKKAGKDKKRLLKILTMHTKDKKTIEEAISLIKKHGSIDYATVAAKKIVTEAWKDANAVLPEGRAKDKIKALADFSIEREV
ncbi:MAG: polyprenyl synthetase family protein [Candidatus Aenigmarchaeota archaeon]|nr:polyprenyl synthetase family protein [Candidatus Aenigmarchaeota archaeon]